MAKIEEDTNIAARKEHRMNDETFIDVISWDC